MPTSRSKSNSNPLTSPAVPVALQPHHLLSPPADLLTNTATTLTITPTPDTKPPSPAFIVHRIRAHEAPDSPDRAVLLYSVYSKPWPNTSRVVCDTEEVPLLVLRRVWLSRKWAVRLPDQHQDLLVATVPWTADGQSRVGVGVGGGFRLEARFANALASRPGSGIIRGRAVGAEESGYVADEPPPYSAIAGVGVEGGGGSASTPRHSQQPRSPSILPSYDSVRRDAPNPLRDLLDALEPPHEPAPAALYPVSASASRNLNAGIGTSTSLGPIHAEADAIPGAKVELRVMQVATSGTGVMMGNQKIMNITRHNAMDFSKSKVRLRPRWEVEVSEGVDLLLAVNLVLIMAESVSSQNRWK
ncbi:hypothetical protein Pdw03_0572 [Penicillium digitatum]|uniref:Uncharacterized protein n=1 Tax=Penicillium digitatum TaxID=36651 RepID=A0A7T6XQQ8_PENDI|nr:hypothetical protein Pdw03_0572 [Penicillium digitatum]